MLESCRYLRTSTGFFFDLDVTQRRSADAIEVFAVVAIIALGKLEKSHTRKRSSTNVEEKEMGDWLGCERELDVSVKYNTRNIYHLLRRALGQCIAIS